MSVSAIDTGLSIFMAVKELFSKNVGKEEQKRALEVLLRQYNFEVSYNKQILDTINFNSRLNDDRIGTIRRVAPLLKNEFGKTIVTSLGFLEESLKDIDSLYTAITEDSIVEDNKYTSGLVSMIAFTANRIEVLKNLALMPDEKHLRKINVSIRLKNIKKITDKIYEAFRLSFNSVMEQVYV